MDAHRDSLQEGHDAHAVGNPRQRPCGVSSVVAGAHPAEADGAGVRAVPGVRCPHRAAAAIQGGCRGPERLVLRRDDHAPEESSTGRC